MSRDGGDTDTATVEFSVHGVDVAAMNARAHQEIRGSGRALPHIQHEVGVRLWEGSYSALIQWERGTA